MKTVGDIMNEAITAPAEALLDEVARTMDVRRISCIPLVDENGKLCGLVSKTDVVHYALQSGKEPPKCSEVMTPAVVTCTADTALVEAARLMRDHRVHHIVITADDEVKGIVSTFDLLDALLRLMDILGNVSSY